MPVGSTVTLTARKGEIPVTFLNETDQTLRVKVRLESDKLFFPDGAEREVELPPRNTTIGFTVESRASGTFPLELTVTSIDDELVIQSTRVRVRSTFVSGVGVFLTAVRPRSSRCGGWSTSDGAGGGPRPRDVTPREVREARG